MKITTSQTTVGGQLAKSRQTTESHDMQPPDPRRGWTSASNAAADAACQGRHAAQKGLPDVSSADAQFGTQIHAALSTGNDTGLDAQQISIAETCREIEEKLVSQAFGAEAPKAKIFREQRLWCMIDGKFEHSATPDFVARIGPKGLIIEYKTLPSDVPEAPQNQQLRDQCVLSARTYILTDVAVAVVQPLISHSPGVCVYTPEDIERSEKEMFERVRKSNDPSSPRTAGEIQCKFCKAKDTCKEYAAWSKTMLPAPVGIFDVPVAQWSPEQCATFCERMSFAAKWLEDCKEQMKARLAKDPNAIPGWALDEGATRATITNPQEVFNRFIAKGGTPEQFMACVKLTKAPLETALRAVTQAKGKTLKAEMDKLLEGTFVEKQDAPSLGRRKG